MEAGLQWRTRGLLQGLLLLFHCGEMGTAPHFAQKALDNDVISKRLVSLYSLTY